MPSGGLFTRSRRPSRRPGRAREIPMDVLSLLEPEPPPPRRMTRTEALLASLSLHLLVVLLALFLPQHLPAPLLAFLSARPPHTEASPEPPDAKQAQAGTAAPEP